MRHRGTPDVVVSWPVRRILPAYSADRLVDTVWRYRVLASIRKFILLAVSVCIVLSSFLGSALPITRADVVFNGVTATPPTSGSIAAFSVSMNVQQAVAANAGHFVYMRFPVSFSVPSSIATTAIQLKGVFSPSKVTVQQTADGTTVGFDIVGSVGNPSLQRWELVQISILETAGIRLPFAVRHLLRVSVDRY